MKQSRNNNRRGALARAYDYIRALLNYLSDKWNTVVIGEKFKSGVTVSEVVKYIVYSVVFIIILLLQVTFFARFTVFGRIPDIMIIAVAVVAMLENEHAGAIFGLCFGYLVEALGSTGTTLLPLIYMLTGYFCGVVATDYYKRSVLLFLIFDIAAAAVRFFTTAVYIMFKWNSSNMAQSLINVAMPEFFATLAVSFVPALLLLPVYKIFRRHEEKKPGLED